ncbi:MAG: hypothetical protein AYK22_07595 [Thermoplasmatales archaeon SG8-52-3]|nr:MAG: hypothetical protein AYK22_07595 [Thermoplasmatales archaeon SG8-52-3]
MNQKTRIEKDITIFEENLKKIKKNSLTLSQKKTKELAKQYYNDSKYYLDKKDYFTAFGCINYAHGLLDSIINF